MKNIFVILALSMLTACSSDFLDIKPEYYPNGGAFYETENQFEQAVAGMYSTMRGTVGIPGFIMGEMRSDNTHYTRYEANRAWGDYEEVADFTDDSEDVNTNSMYTTCYQGISRANTILNRIEGKPFSENFIREVTGQAYFFRAYYYFCLVRFYGGVSLYLDEVSDPESSFLPRASVDEVYEVILDDAKNAVSLLDKPAFPQNGKISQGSARMLLAKVLMTKPQRDYSEAIRQLQEIMKMGYDLMSTYEDVFDTSKKNNIESLFEVQYQQGNQGQNSDWLYRFIPKTAEAELITGVPNSNTIGEGGWNVPTQEMVDSYESGDERLLFSIKSAVGNTNSDGLFVLEAVLNVDDSRIGNYSSSYYFINKYRHPHSRLMNTDDNWPIYRYSDVLLSLAECYVETNQANLALPLVNQVRNRAGLPSVSTVTADLVADERRHEFAFENQRWFDLVRTGKAIEVMTEHGKRMKALYPYIQKRAYNVTKERLVYPIPYRELQINTQLKQNQGYN
ncbi:RagB/SusD family nutrient uptake outer membrane protein [Parabacteroides sp. APC149_11_2_Y6]